MCKPRTHPYGEVDVHLLQSPPPLYPRENHPLVPTDDVAGVEPRARLDALDSSFDPAGNRTIYRTSSPQSRQYTDTATPVPSPAGRSPSTYWRRGLVPYEWSVKKLVTDQTWTVTTKTQNTLITLRWILQLPVQSELYTPKTVFHSGRVYLSGCLIKELQARVLAGFSWRSTTATDRDSWGRLLNLRIPHRCEERLAKLRNY
jgi:hypothetical protein